MSIGKWAVRFVLFIVGMVLSLVLLTILTIQIQQHMLRWRAERLSADMHRIRLYQSTWVDAQQLMHRWGAWGRYDGTCTAIDCAYEIKMGSINSYTAPHHTWLDWLFRHDRLNLFHRFGGRDSVFTANFRVHNGTIWRTGAWIAVTIPRFKMRIDNDPDWTMSIGATSYQRLHRTLKNWEPFMNDSEEELALHPYYKVGRPGGCMINCRMGIVYYSTHTPTAEIERLTSYNFSCFTRLIPCTEYEDLLPAAKEWHLYKESEYTQSYLPAKTCNIPVWALARDTRYALSVEALANNRNAPKSDPHITKVRVITSLKEPAPWLPHTVVSAHPFPGGEYPSHEEAEHLIPGRRYIVFPVGNDRRTQIVTKDSPITLDRCSVQEDTPEIRRELEKGFAQNDSMNP